MKCGTVTIMGRPNVGKSTLLNSLMNMKLAITTDKAGTTRNIIEGIYQDEDSQIIFIDTPGIHKPMYKLGNLLNRKAYQNIDNADIILFLIDGSTGFGKGDQFVLNKLEEKKDTPLFLIINKIDKMKKEQLIQTINQVKDVCNFAEIIPISALKKTAIQDLIHTIKKYLPLEEAIFEENELTNVSTRFLMAEFVREKAMMLTRQEVPHAITCYVENYEEEDNLVHIQVLLVVDRENLKKILIGKGGSMLKKVGTLARHDMEEFLGKKVYLELHVKVIENWRDQEKLLKELGFDDE
ncbi:MAG TPA: GTPase Era [Candidatus Onthousia faecigallinarum]|nr:GTPase Era [Candidatus Onthousia faecigallinarum]